MAQGIAPERARLAALDYVVPLLDLGGGVHPKHDVGGFCGYLLAYRGFTSTASLRGYLQYLTGTARRWR